MGDALRVGSVARARRHRRRGRQRGDDAYVRTSEEDIAPIAETSEQLSAVQVGSGKELTSSTQAKLVCSLLSPPAEPKNESTLQVATA